MRSKGQDLENRRGGGRLAILVLLAFSLVASAGEVWPVKTALDLNNPHKGFILWATDYAEGAPDNFYSSTVYHVYMPWREVETADQAFAWGRFETNHLKPILDDDPLATFILRPVADYPDGENSGITGFYTGGELQRDFPRFLIEPPLNLTYWTYTDCDGDGPGWTPDWNNAAMITQMTQFIAAIRGRYDGDPRITAIQAGLLGLWGEWHQSGCETHEPGSAAKVAVRDAYRLFTNTPIQIRYARDPDSIGVQFGFHEDYFPSFTAPCIYGFPDCDDTGDWSLYYGFTMVNTAAVNNWRFNPITGESPEDDQKRTWSNDFNDVMTVIRDYHFTGLGPAGGHEWSGNQVKLQAMKRALGYNLHLERVAWPDRIWLDWPFDVTVVFTNSGSAPCYHRFPVELALCYTNGTPAWTGTLSCDLRQALPGALLEHTESVTISGAATGVYSVRLGVLDPRTGQPGVRLQSAGEDANRRCVCGLVVLSPDPAHADSNGDGVPDLWYLTYGLDPTNPVVGTLDGDEDGFTNRDEWRAGTHPTNGQSYLCVAGIASPDGESNIALRWVGVSGVLYNVERLTNLAVQPQSAMKIATNLAGQGDWITHGDTGALGPGPWMYRVGVE
ncbi:MAG: DUF4832 domain-containing protein [Verrucomicrobia bacterium]|nr:DUF4832 domain-containing protein [Verrucomicrobiota bacterium]MBU1910744.1 DUF4832 domain-containing protein [Verrucomicrobiota bacterium]